MNVNFVTKKHIQEEHMIPWQAGQSQPTCRFQSVPVPISASVSAPAPDPAHSFAPVPAPASAPAPSLAHRYFKRFMTQQRRRTKLRTFKLSFHN